MARWKLMLAPARFVCLTALLTLSGCGVTAPDALEVRVEASDWTVTPDRPLRLDVVGRNVGAEHLDVAVGPCPQPFDVRLPDGVLVGPKPAICTLILLAPVRLAPGEEARAKYTWSGLEYDGAPLPAGTYALRAWMDPVAGGRSYSDVVTVEVRDEAGAAAAPGSRHREPRTSHPPAS